MWRFLLLLGIIFAFPSCGVYKDDDKEDSDAGLHWFLLDSGLKEPASKKLVYRELFGTGNTLRLHQSMCIWDSKAFCMNDGIECKVLDLESNNWLETVPLPDKSHHNNAQFSGIYHNKDDKYPLLLLSRGSYAPDRNDVYIVKVNDTANHFSFSSIKTIHNSIREAMFNGSWVIDSDHNKLFLYCMTKGDYRLKEDNRFCVFSFRLPDFFYPNDIVLGYQDVIDRWEYDYLTLQGGTYYNNYLLFNVQSLSSVDGRTDIVSTKDVIAINTMTGKIEAIMPLEETIETEGICVFDNKLYVSFKQGSPDQKEMSVVFALYEYTLPSSILMD